MSFVLFRFRDGTRGICRTWNQVEVSVLEVAEKCLVGDGDSDSYGNTGPKKRGSVDGGGGKKAGEAE
jgi:hypothetical protein